MRTILKDRKFDIENRRMYEKKQNRPVDKDTNVGCLGFGVFLIILFLVSYLIFSYLYW